MSPVISAPWQSFHSLRVLAYGHRLPEGVPLLCSKPCSVSSSSVSALIIAQSCPRGDHSPAVAEEMITGQ